MSANHPFKPPLENFRFHNFQKRNKIKKLIYVVDLKENSFSNQQHRLTSSFCFFLRNYEI